MKTKLAQLAQTLSERYEWVDNLLDILWRGRCYHLRYRTNRIDRASVAKQCHLLDTLGPWTVSLETVDLDRAPPGTYILVVYRGKSLLRWSTDITIEHWEIDRPDRTLYRLLARTVQLWPEPLPLAQC